MIIHALASTILGSPTYKERMNRCWPRFSASEFIFFHCHRDHTVPPPATMELDYLILNTFTSQRYTGGSLALIKVPLEHRIALSLG